uniref:DUF3987 domain-containing protein n=1 Tax=Thermosporothrix sp. COM3 TaxID=2490863 RepID=A0A455SP64_9CHLR|nr:hypothetical protein KTC_48630 [Thermosporothrix sp. COM3]BBH90177.1 hypothetical protein KTC_49280 [Thermosporothrix sp. COM3]BBH90242.1 hypothetical protein KTC_49930 [Thermosporothrix sp. COM3]
MVAAPSSLTAKQAAMYDQRARDYFTNLKAGKKPQNRPDLGPDWEDVADMLEAPYERAKGDPEAIERVFTALAKTHPALADLLSTPSAPLARAQEIGFPELPEQAHLPEELSRGACQYLEVYEAFSKQASPEGYEAYHVFCGMWLLSTVASRRVYLPLQTKRIYGNLMIALYGKSSVFAKSTTAQVAVDVLFNAGLGHLLAPKRVSPAKLLSDMAGVHIPAQYEDLDAQAQERIRKRLSMAGQRGLYFDEFGKFVQSVLRRNSTNAEFVSLFLELDGCPSEFDSSTISRGSEVIKRPYLSLLGCMTPPNIRENAGSGADFWTDGFWARFSFVAAPPVTPKDATLELGELLIPEELVRPLQRWHERLGVPACELEPVTDKNGSPTGRYNIVREELPETQATMSSEAYEAYKRYRTALKKLFWSFPHEDFNASYTRLPETALRMSLLMASLENNNHIELRHWAKAQELAEILRLSLHELYAQVNLPASTETEGAKLEDAIMRIFKRQGALTLNTLRTSYLKKYSSKQLEDALKAMIRAGIVEKYATSHSEKYRLKEEEPEEDGTDDN